MGKAEPGLGDELEVHQLLDGRVVGGPDVLDADPPGFDGVGQGLGLTGLAIQELLHGHGRWRRPPTRRNAP